MNSLPSYALPHDTLVIVAHPDDETLGAGGTIAKIAAAGGTVRCVSFTDGVSARGVSVSEREIRGKAGEEAAAELGFSWLGNFDFPDNGLDTVPRLELARTLETLIADIKPELVITHFGSDLNRDHQIVSEIVQVAFRPIPDSPRPALWAFETASSTHWSPQSAREFSPTIFVDVSNHLAQKNRALNAYSAEMREWPHARSAKALESLSEFRGSTIGVSNAEAFELIRQGVGEFR